MRIRTATSLLLACLTLGIMGATPRDPRAPPSVLEELPLFQRGGADPGNLEASAFSALGIPRRWSTAHLVSMVDSWLAGEGVARCGHEEAHELVSTACTLAPGGVLDGLLQKVLRSWYQSRLLDAAQVTLLNGGPPAFLKATHSLENQILRVETVEVTPEDLQGERLRLKQLGVTGADLWSNLDVARSLRRRRAEEFDLQEVSSRLNPEGLDLRRSLMEGLIRPLALYLGETGTGGEKVRAFVEDFGKETPELGPLLAPDAAPAPTQMVALEAPIPVVVAVASLPAPSPPPQTLETSVPVAAATGFAVSYGGTRFAGRR